MKIFENYTYTLINGRNNYFKDLNICFTKYYDAIYITDLENALKTGKECKEYIIKIEKNKYMPYSKKFILDLKNGKYDNSVSIRTHKSIKIFTPFVKIKPIKIPTKWKISNIWKAILSGQITKITKKYRTTDDFAYDNSVNFEKGKKINPYKKKVNKFIIYLSSLSVLIIAFLLVVFSPKETIPFSKRDWILIADFENHTYFQPRSHRHINQLL